MDLYDYDCDWRDLHCSATDYEFFNGTSEEYDELMEEEEDEEDD